MITLNFWAFSEKLNFTVICIQFILGEVDESVNHREAVGTVTRICQELPRCNWLEEKILNTGKSGAGNTPTPPPSSQNSQKESE